MPRGAVGEEVARGAVGEDVPRGAVGEEGGASGPGLVPAGPVEVNPKGAVGR